MSVVEKEKQYIYLYLDSSNQQYNTQSRFSTYQIIANNQQYSPNAFNCLYRLKSPIYNVSKLFLKSAEFPVLFHNIRATSLMNTLPIRCSSVLKTLIIPDSTFSSVSSLCSYLTTLATSQYPSDNIVFTIHTNSCIKISSITHSSIYMETSNLSSVLGFKQGIDTLTSNNCIGTYKPNLSYDDKIYIFIENMNTNSQSCLNFNTTFKIPVSANSGVLNFTNSNSIFEQYIEYPSSTPLTELNIIIYDKFGYNLHAQGADISFTFCVEYE
jgi:hypothetical protein